MNCGVYKITNLKNNKVYVGSSIDISSREYKHFWMLKKGIHDNTHLQKSYKKYGKDNFEFIILENCPESEIIERENFYIKKYNSNNSSHGYNLAMVNDFRRNTYNDEVKIKLSKHNLKTNGNFNKFKLTSLLDNRSVIYDNLIDAAEYLISNGYTKGSMRNVRMKLSLSLRGKKVNNGYNGSVRKTCYKHTFEIIN